MKISIVTAVFNAVDSIEDTIQSVASQTHPDIEHIVVDGASTDGTMEVVDRHRNKLSKVISEPDQGIYDAMNKGLALATGDVIGFLNADDFYASDHVLADVLEAIQREDLDAAYGDVAFVRPEDRTRVVRRYRSDRFSPERLAWGWMPAHPALFLHRRVFDRFGPFRTDYRIAGDFEFVARAFKCGSLRSRYLPEVFVYMRTGGASTGGWRNTVLLNREVLRACRENAIPTHPLKVLSKYSLKFLEFLRK